MDTNVSEEQPASIISVEMTLMMEAAFPPKQSYPPTILHGVTAQKITF
jgi:hypothetical protein